MAKRGEQIDQLHSAFSGEIIPIFSWKAIFQVSPALALWVMLFVNERKSYLSMNHGKSR